MHNTCCVAWHGPKNHTSPDYIVREYIHPADLCYQPTLASLEGVLQETTAVLAEKFNNFSLKRDSVT